MSDLKLTILGNGSAVPTSFSSPSSQLLTSEKSQFLFDCGEGTQMQMIKFKVKYRKLENIFISHLHGDHYYGLIGLISTFHLFGREKPLTIYASSALEGLICSQLKVSNTKLCYKLNFVHLEDFSDQVLIEDDTYTIRCFPLIHSIPTWGFVYREKLRKSRINKDFLNDKSLSLEQILKIKGGDDFIDDKGKKHDNSIITIPPKKPLSYAYCSDTAYNELIIDKIKDASLLYHEATFDNAMKKVATEKMHSTAAQAAMIAKKSMSSKLLLGHFSARFNDTNILLKEARELFPNTFISKEGHTYNIENK